MMVSKKCCLASPRSRKSSRRLPSNGPREARTKARHHPSLKTGGSIHLPPVARQKYFQEHGQIEVSMGEISIIDPQSIENLRALNPGDDDAFLREIAGIFFEDTPLRIAELDQSLVA